jgi:mono/diheme cytochrome c family protein
MGPLRRRLMLGPAVAAAAAGLVACGSQGISVPENESAQVKEGAEIFAQRCGGCHTLAAAGTDGSAVDPNDRELKDGPNFNQRKEEYDQVLYAIRNGGFSSGPMPQNIVVGKEAEAVARFLEKYSGKEADTPPSPGQEPRTGSQSGEGLGPEGGPNTP